MNVLIACETSGTVREAFRAKGHNAWSCDLLPADDGSPFHVVGDARWVIANMLTKDCRDMIPRLVPLWDLVICHPPCTHLASSGDRWFKQKQADGRQAEGIELFMSIIAACEENAKAWAAENPIGIMSKLYRKPDQIVQPWQYGHGETKATCLWLKGLPLLKPTNIVAGREPKCHHASPGPDRWKIRSKTYQGIADAMAEQWG